MVCSRESDTYAKRQDNEDWLGPKDGGAVPQGIRPNDIHPINQGGGVSRRSARHKSVSKDWFIEAHEREVADYMDRHPNATWQQAYDRTADRAYDRMADEMADAADMMRDRAKEGE